jgi:hypothetical protein
MADCLASLPQSVIWRSTETSRPWLAGVDAGNGIALLDVQGLLQVLETKAI